MKELGKEMVDHCGGLPLAVIVLGGILASKNKCEEWKVVHKSGNNIGEDEGDVLKILALSYNLQRFAIPIETLEDGEIELEPLYQIWMAEGMILRIKLMMTKH
ncbi:hypothetical protein Leryth_017342 [Lithospermum erythrorhizon]|nr:hypothetical protein Leryth_017342 [Lithospermum erythrorhizon]